MNYSDNSSIAGQTAQTSKPNVIAAVDAAHGAVSQAEQALAQLEGKLSPLLSPEQNQTAAGAQSAQPSSGLLHSYIAELEKRVYQLEAKASSILARLHL